MTSSYPAFTPAASPDTAGRAAAAAYGNAGSALKTQREIEAETLRRSIVALQKAAAEPRITPNVIHTLHDNRRMWLLFASDMALPENRHPPELKAKLLSLTNFVIEQTAKVIAGEARPDTLIEINKTMWRALVGTAEAPAER